MQVAEGAHVLAEGAELVMHGASAAAGTALAMSTVGLLAGLAAHEFAENVRREHVVLGCSLGL